MLPQALDQIADRGFLHELGMSLEAACISASVTAHAAAVTNAPERSTSSNSDFFMMNSSLGSDQLGLGAVGPGLIQSSGSA